MLVKIAIENGHGNSGFAQLQNGGSFHSFLYVYQRLCYTTGGQSFGMIGIGRTMYIYISIHPMIQKHVTFNHEHMNINSINN